MRTISVTKSGTGYVTFSSFGYYNNKNRNKNVITIWQRMN